MIKVEHLYKSFDGVQVLKDINVVYEPGKCKMIIGASGSGKTVLLKNLIGLMTPESGEIIYGDRMMSQMDYQERNQPILKEISPEYSLEGLMLKPKLQYFGHLIGRTDSLEKTLMLGKIEGRSSRRG